MPLMLGLVLMMIPNLFAQETKPNIPQFVTVTTNHWNMNKEGFSMDEWKSMEKEFFTKVTMKNEFIVSTDVLTHFFTGDNTEILSVATYASWADIASATKRNGELARAAWPDSLKRRAFFQKRNSYYDDYHSDEIYSVAPGTKTRTENLEKEMVIYMRISQMAFPEDGTNKEFNEVMSTFNKNVFHKNNLIKSYYPNYHGYGADRRDFIEAFVVESLSDVEKSFDRNAELVESNWPDENKRKAFFDKMKKYFTGVHGDYLYKNIPELMK